MVEYANLPRSVFRRLPIFVVNHSAIEDAWRAKETFGIVAKHAPFLRAP